MSKLPKAPLQEVSAQLKWHLNSDDFPDYGFLAGDYFNFINKKYNKREGLIPDGIPFQLFLNNPTHKFTLENVEFPFIVIGPGVIALNINDDAYYWDSFSSEIKFAFNPIFDIVPKISDFKHIHLSLEYIDFYEVDFKKIKPLQFLKEFLHTTINQDFINQETSNSIDLNFSYEYPEIGSIKLSYNKGKVKGKSEGIIVRTSAISGVYPADLNDTLDWFDKAQEKCSNLFKEMTKGVLYESFI